MKQNRTRTALADAYMHLLNDYTIDRITVKMITDAVGCSRKTFYYYFTDVYVLTQYVFELRVQQFLDTNASRGRRAITMPARSSRATRRTWTSRPRISRRSSACTRT